MFLIIYFSYDPQINLRYFIYTHILFCSLWLIHTCGARNGTEKHPIVKGIDNTMSLRSEPPLDLILNTFLLFFCKHISATQKYHINFALFLISKSNLCNLPLLNEQ